MEAFKSKKILILISHPDSLHSFNHKMAMKAHEILTAMGHKVRLVDLVAIKFRPDGGPHDFKKVQNLEKFDYQHEQKYAVENNNFSDEVKEQMDNLTWCDYVIHQFPFYWFSVPAVHKGWCDRVLAYHYAYGGGSNLAGRKWLTSTTTGGPEKYYTGSIGDTVENFLKHFNLNTPKLIGMETLPIFVAHGVNFASDAEKQKYLEDWVEYLKKHVV